MSARKSSLQKANTGSSEMPLTQQTAADQLTFVAPEGLPEHLSIIDNDPDAQEIYYALGGALVKYESLFQNIDSYTLCLASMDYVNIQKYANMLELEGHIITEAKSHTAKSEDNEVYMTKREHPAVKMKRDAATDFRNNLKMLGLDLKGRTAIMVQLSMVKAMHGNDNSGNIHLNFIQNMEVG